MNENQTAKPFLKWAGGKGQLLPEIRKFYPDELGKTINKYCEPMVGAGAVLFDILNNYNLEEIYINDVNYELINTYKVIKNNVKPLIKQLEILQQEHISRAESDRKLFYYDNRKKFNELMQIPDKSNSVCRASLFIYLNRTCFNGLYRVNRNGLFNVPMGSYKNPIICDKENLILASEKLKKVKICCGDYSKMKKYLDCNTFVYFDPPYRPLTKTAEFTSYNSEIFDDKKQKKLAKFIKELSENGVSVLASNSDPKNVDENDDFFEKIYEPLNINRVNAKRCINSKGNDRGFVTELLINNF